jgi:hypothetical protein
MLEVVYKIPTPVISEGETAPPIILLATSPSSLIISIIIFQRRNYMVRDRSMKLGNGGRSDEKRQKIQEIGVGHRRRGAMLSVQSKAIN